MNNIVVAFVRRISGFFRIMELLIVRHARDQKKENPTHGKKWCKGPFWHISRPSLNVYECMHMWYVMGWWVMLKCAHLDTIFFSGGGRRQFFHWLNLCFHHDWTFALKARGVHDVEDVDSNSREHWQETIKPRSVDWYNVITKSTLIHCLLPRHYRQYYAMFVKHFPPPSTIIINIINKYIDLKMCVCGNVCVLSVFTYNQHICRSACTMSGYKIAAVVRSWT